MSGRALQIDADRHALAARLIAEQGIAPEALMIPHADLEQIVAKAVLHGGQLAIAHALDVRVCRVCGCTQLMGCHPACWWVGVDLCSTCEPFVCQTVEARLAL